MKQETKKQLKLAAEEQLRAQEQLELMNQRQGTLKQVKQGTLEPRQVLKTAQIVEVEGERGPQKPMPGSSRVSLQTGALFHQDR